MREFLRQGGQVPHTLSDAEYEAGIPEISDEGAACAKAVCNYIYDTYGKFPGTVDTMHLMWWMQAHHLDLDFYDRFFNAGHTPTHTGAIWRLGTGSEKGRLYSLKS